jgi:hypothetical protein
MRGSISTGAMLLGLATFAMPAFAGTVYNTSLATPNLLGASPSELPNGSFYNGTGNGQGGFAVTTDTGGTGIELGLSAVLAFVSPLTPVGNSGLYIVPTGTGSNGHATWDYEFSIDLNPGGTAGGLTFADISTASLTITDVTNPASGSYNPTLLPDDATYGSNGNAVPTSAHTSGVLSADWGAQNAESLSFGFPAIGFNPWDGDTYQITLSVTTDAANGSDTVSDTITVQAVPEPASMALLGSGMIALGALRRRRRG